jgi:hypothetical protein
LPTPPVVTYRDTAGALKTWAATNYIVEAPAGPRCQRGRLALAYGISWPTTYGQIGDVTVRFVCGYANAASVPYLLKAAMLVRLTELFTDREGKNEPSRFVRETYFRYHAWSRQRRAL